MNKLELVRYAKDGIEAQIEKVCADIAECGFAEYRAEKLYKLFQKYEEVTAELKAIRKEEREKAD